MNQDQEKIKDQGTDRIDPETVREGQAQNLHEEANGERAPEKSPEMEAHLAEESRTEEETQEANGEMNQEETQEGNEVEALKSLLDQERQKVEELQQRLLRLHADFDNFRKRAQREKEEFAKYASRSLLEKLLPAIDNLERALQSSTDNADALIQGVQMVYRQIMEALEQEGAKPIEAVGKPFDPYYHQAVMRVESEEHEPGIVIEEFQKGYILKDKVIRPAMVKVTS